MNKINESSNENMILKNGINALNKNSKALIRNDILTYLVEFINFNDYENIILAGGYFSEALEIFLVNKITYQHKEILEKKDSVVSKSKEDSQSNISIGTLGKKDKNKLSFFNNKYYELCFLIDKRSRYLFSKVKDKLFKASEKTLLNANDFNLNLKTLSALVYENVHSKLTVFYDFEINIILIVKHLTSNLASVFQYEGYKINLTSTKIDFELLMLLIKLIDMCVVDELDLSFSTFECGVENLLNAINTSKIKYITINLTGVELNKACINIIYSMRKTDIGKTIFINEEPKKLTSKSKSFKNFNNNSNLPTKNKSKVILFKDEIIKEENIVEEENYSEVIFPFNNNNFQSKKSRKRIYSNPVDETLRTLDENGENTKIFNKKKKKAKTENKGKLLYGKGGKNMKYNVNEFFDYDYY